MSTYILPPPPDPIADPIERMAIRIAHYARQHGLSAANDLRKAVSSGRTRKNFESALQMACERDWVGMEAVEYRGHAGRRVYPVDNSVDNA